MPHLRRYFLSGLLVWIPIWVTIVVLRFIFNLLDGSLAYVPAKYQPSNLFGVNIPGLGVVFTIIVILVTGLIAANFLGKRIVHLWDSLIDRIPLVRSVHAGVKKVLMTVFSPSGQAFRKVLLVEYPRKGLWSVAFQTGEGCDEVSDALGGVEMVTIFIPTTPNPTSGFLMMLPRSEVIELDMTTDQGLKFVVSLGVVQSGNGNGNGKRVNCKT
jgi:uncharacterized membrane protein